MDLINILNDDLCLLWQYALSTGKIWSWSQSKFNSKVVPLQARRGSEGSRRFRLPADNRHMKMVSSSASRTGLLYPQKCFWYSFSLRAESTPRPWCGRKEICHWNIQWHHRESIPGTKWVYSAYILGSLSPAVATIHIYLRALPVFLQVVCASAEEFIISWYELFCALLREVLLVCCLPLCHSCSHSAIVKFPRRNHSSRSLFSYKIILPNIVITDVSVERTAYIFRVKLSNMFLCTAVFWR